MNHTYYTPCVVRETAEGLTRIPIQDLLFQRRSVELVGEITSDSVHSLALQLRYLQLEDPNAEITIYINSPGGEVTSGLALYDVMKGLSCPVKTVCMGTAASMAALLFVAGSQREMLPSHDTRPPHSWRRGRQRPQAGFHRKGPHAHPRNHGEYSRQPQRPQPGGGLRQDRRRHLFFRRGGRVLGPG